MLGPVSISVPTLVVELVIFLGMVYLMEAMVFSPIRAKWAERNRQIQAGLASSSEGRDEAEHAREEVRRILTEARARAQSVIDEVTTAGNRERDELTSRATAEFRRLVDDARGKLQSDQELAAATLQGRVVDLALLAASNVTGQAFNEPHVRDLAAGVVQREGLAV
jgi:F-type H+-transporting ATPase subunit b